MKVMKVMKFCNKKDAQKFARKHDTFTIQARLTNSLYNEIEYCVYYFDED